MRALATGTAALFSVACVFAVASACGSSDPGGTNSLADGGDVDPAYCNKYCRAQESNRTLEGTREDCIQQCCATLAVACTPDNAGVDAGDGGRTNVGDGATVCPKPCGVACCASTETCVEESPGSPSCVPTCNKGTDCASGCCAPATNAAGDPVGPYICKPNDGKPYHCCNGITTTCAGDSCCATDQQGNEFCAQRCAGNASCGAAHCVTVSLKFSTCQGSTACGP